MITEVCPVLYSITIFTQLAMSHVFLNQHFISGKFSTKRDSVIQSTGNRLIFSCSFKKRKKNFRCQYILKVRFNTVVCRADFRKYLLRLFLHLAI